MPITSKISKLVGHNSPSRATIIGRPSSPYIADAQQLSDTELEDLESATLVVYVGLPGRFADKTRFICSLWSMNLLLPHLTVSPVLLNTTNQDYPDVVLNMDVEVFSILHSCICASEGVSGAKSKDLVLFAKLWAFADGSISDTLIEEVSFKVSGIIEQSGIRELQEVMSFICSEDHTKNAKLASMRDTLIGRLAVLGINCQRLEGRLIPASILTDVMVCINELEYRQSPLCSKSPKSNYKQRRPKVADKSNEVAWQDLLNVLDLPSNFI